jgi:hypothetical protein
MNVLFLLLLSFIPYDSTEVHYVDTIEINSMHDDKGRHVFDQIIFWSYSDIDRKEHVRQWLLMKNSRIDNPEEQAAFEKKEKLKPEEKRFHYIRKFNYAHPLIPEYTPDGYVVRIEQAGVIYKIIGKNYKHTYRQDDVELEDQQFVPKEFRKPIFANSAFSIPKVKSILIKHND